MTFHANKYRTADVLSDRRASHKTTQPARHRSARALFAVLFIAQCGCCRGSTFLIDKVAWPADARVCNAALQVFSATGGYFAVSRVPLDGRDARWSSHSHTEWFEGGVTGLAPTSSTSLLVNAYNPYSFGVVINDASPLTWREFEYPRDVGVLSSHPTEEGILLQVLGKQKEPAHWHYAVCSLGHFFGEPGAPAPVRLDRRAGAIEASPARFGNYGPALLLDLDYPNAQIIRAELAESVIRVGDPVPWHPEWYSPVCNARADHVAVIDSEGYAKIVRLHDMSESVLCSTEGISGDKSFSVCLTADGSYAAYMRPFAIEGERWEMEVVLVSVGDSARIRALLPLETQSRLLSFVPETTDVLLADYSGHLYKVNVYNEQMILLLDAPGASDMPLTGTTPAGKQ